MSYDVSIIINSRKNQKKCDTNSERILLILFIISAFEINECICNAKLNCFIYVHIYIWMYCFIQDLNKSSSIYHLHVRPKYVLFCDRVTCWHHCTFNIRTYPYCIHCHHLLSNQRTVSVQTKPKFWPCIEVSLSGVFDPVWTF